MFLSLVFIRRANQLCNSIGSYYTKHNIVGKPVQVYNEENEHVAVANNLVLFCGFSHFLYIYPMHSCVCVDQYYIPYLYKLVIAKTEPAKLQCCQHYSCSSWPPNISQGSNEKKNTDGHSWKELINKQSMACHFHYSHNKPLPGQEYVDDCLCWPFRLTK